MGNDQSKPPPTLPLPSNESSSTPSPSLPFSTILIANRGEIALRLIRAVHSLNLKAVAVFVPNDASSPHLAPADIVIPLATDNPSYSNPHALLLAAKTAKADAVLPGYGFVSENPAAAALFEQNGIRWIGPEPNTIELFGLKHTAREAARKAGVPTVPGSPVLQDLEQAKREVERIGFPALLKASAGGGGMGQAIVRTMEQLERGFEGVVKQAEMLFGSGEVYLERFVEEARHVEVQVFGDGKGGCVALGDRDCSVQRRRQKVIEEGDAPMLDGVRGGLREAAVNLCGGEKYRSAGTVEFIVDAESLEWYFLEVNTRLQVEHGVTELVSGIDIVRWMILQAGGVEVLKEVEGGVVETGVAIESRIYAENPVKDYVPCPGVLSEMIWPKEGVAGDGWKVRVDSWAQRGTVVPGSYDPLLGKVLVWGRTRALAIVGMKKALGEVVVRGVMSNVELLLQVMDHPDFLVGEYTTALLNTMTPRTRSVEVIKPGLQSSLQDYPGRVGYWDIGVSPSGPMDSYAMGMANALVGNPVSCCALEITMSGPTLLFHCDAIIAITGGRFEAELDDGKPVEFWTPVAVQAGSVLTVGQALDGSMAYLAVRNGFDAPKYLGSASTFPTGKFGGLTGSFLVAGDFLPVGDNDVSHLDQAERNGLTFRWPLNKTLPNDFIPTYNPNEWVVAALNGPHASADFLQEETLKSIWTTSYVVHHAKNRLGARLIGPAPKWTRPDGGSAGLHPSNLHDYTYAPGAVNFSGNTPIVLMLDGPSLGGFVCPITVATADLWKIAQAKPGEKIKFKQVNYDVASSAAFSMESAWEAVRMNDSAALEKLEKTWTPVWANDCEAQQVPAILASLDPKKGDRAEIKVVYRMSGDEHILIEYGDIELDLAYRLRVHMLMEELKGKSFIKELCPGVRSLLVRYSRKDVHVKRLLTILIQLESGGLGSVENVVVPSRVLKMPLSFEDKWTVEAQGRYLRSVRPDAPYMPSNVEFVRRINGLSSVEEVKKIMTSAEYMVLGLGDVYLGAPCAVPVDPRHRMVTSKYNPARTYTPEGAVGIGGAYMCIYGMDSPGGYQLTARTLPIWDNYGSVPEKNRGAPKDVPWLLRFFDRVKFFPVSDDELERLRSEYRKGRYQIEILEEKFSYKQYVQFCNNNKRSISAFELKRKAAYDAERARWEAEGEGESNAAAEHASRDTEKGSAQVGDDSSKPNERPPFSISVKAGVAASVWAVYVKDGDVVEKGQALFTLESMKVEIGIDAPDPGTVRMVSAEKGQSVSPDRELCIVVSSEEGVLGNASIDHLKGLYKLGTVRPELVIKHSLKNAKQAGRVFSAVSPEKTCDEQLTSLRNLRARNEYSPLQGIPFVVADDIDVQEFKTNNSCPEIAYTAKTTDTIVAALQHAGAVLIGKTSVDQLNIGNTGFETPGAAIASPTHPGSTAGGNGAAAIAVRQQIASFAIVVDRNGTSAVCPALCGVVGLKVTEGLLPVLQSETSCEAADSVGIIANNASDVKRVLDILMSIRDSSTSICRPMPNPLFGEVGNNSRGITFACFSAKDMKMAVGDDLNAGAAYETGLETIKRLGYHTLGLDMSVFSDASALFDEIPLQYANLNELDRVVRRAQASLLPTVSQRLSAAEKLSALSFGAALTKLRSLKRASDAQIWSKCDAAVFPVMTGSSKFVESSEGVEQADQKLSRFCRLFTAMDLCSVTFSTASAGPPALPQGITVAAPAFKERILLDFASKWEKQ